MIKNLKKLISFKTISGNLKENKKALSWIKNEVKNLPVFVKEFNSNNFPSLTITTQQTTRPIVWLAAHIDVADGKNELFSAKIKSGKVYGRGVFDMKYAIASYLKILTSLNKKLNNYNFGIMITSDEEIDGENGTKYLLDKGMHSNICFLPDSGENWARETGSKGLWCFKVTSRGKFAHPSTPWHGVNAAENLIEFLAEIKKMFIISPYEKAHNSHNSININEINTGKTGDVIPDYAEALVDVFFTSNQEYKKIFSAIKQKMKKFAQMEISTFRLADSFEMQAKNKYADLFYDIANKRFQIKHKTFFSNGVSDARFFVKRGIYTIETRPKGGNHHCDDEWIDLNDLNKFHTVLMEFIIKISENKKNNTKLNHAKLNPRTCPKINHL